MKVPKHSPETIAARDPSTWQPEVLQRIQDILDRSSASAGRAARETFNREHRRMSAREVVQFWNQTKVKAMSTISPKGKPHIAPIHASFENGTLRTTIYTNAVRRRDLRANPEVALTTWGENGAAVILYGRASEVPGSEKETRPGASGTPRRTVTLNIDVHRIYAMNSRE